MNYTIKQFTGSGPWKFNHHRAVVGLDLGSRASKGVLLTSRKIYTTLILTGLYMQETADELLKKLLRLARVKRADIGYIVSTGYGRISLEFPDIPFEVVTEISCHAMGAHALYPSTRTIIDIGGSIVADGDRRLLDIIEKELGLQVVVEDHCTGLKPFYHDTPYSDDPFQTLADGYLEQAP